MITRERQHHDHEERTVPAAPAPDTATRDAADHLMAEAEEAITHALSQDSMAFLTAGRQLSGQ